MIIRCKMYFVFFIFVVCANHKNIFTMKFFQIYGNIDLHDVFCFVTAVDCGNLTDLANGRVDHTTGTTFGQNATYSCDTGYNLVRNSTRTCQATGNWSGSASTCEGVCIQRLITGDVTWCCLTLTTCYQLVLIMDFSTGCHGSCFGWLLFFLFLVSRNKILPLWRHHFWYCRQFLVRRKNWWFESLNCLLMSGCVQSHKPPEIGSKMPWF